MADIDIERKKRSPLPLILGLLALALLAFLLMQTCGGDDDVEAVPATDTTTVPAAVAPMPVTDTTMAPAAAPLPATDTTTMPATAPMPGMDTTTTGAAAAGTSPP